MDKKTNYQDLNAKSEDSSKRADLLNARKSSLKEQQNNQHFEWLTENSRNFLAAGYLAPGLSPEQRIREIADRAEEILGIKGYSDKFYHYMSQGFFSLASPVWSNFGKKKRITNKLFWI
jgi:ribonucleoside-diphosphate reductase alpha chain